MIRTSLHSVLLFVGLLLLGGSAALSQAQDKSEEDVKILRRKTYARTLMDEIEKKLMEPPNDGRFGVSRLVPMFVLKVHAVKGMEVFGAYLPNTPQGTRAEIYTLGLCDKQGVPSRITRGSQVAAGRGRPGPKVPVGKVDGLDAALKQTVARLVLSGRKESWTTERVQGRSISIFARTIQPKEDCLACHEGAQMGKAMGAAAVTLVPLESNNQPTQRP